MITQQDIDNLNKISDILLRYNEEKVTLHIPKNMLYQFNNTINKVKEIVNKDLMYTREQYDRVFDQLMVLVKNTNTKDKTDWFKEFKKTHDKLVRFHKELNPISELLKIDKIREDNVQPLINWIKESIEIRDKYIKIIDNTNLMSEAQIAQSKQNQQYKSDNDRMKDYLGKDISKEDCKNALDINKDNRNTLKCPMLFKKETFLLNLIDTKNVTEILRPDYPNLSEEELLHKVRLYFTLSEDFKIILSTMKEACEQTVDLCYKKED